MRQAPSSTECPRPHVGSTRPSFPSIHTTSAVCSDGFDSLQGLTHLDRRKGKTRWLGAKHSRTYSSSTTRRRHALPWLRPCGSPALASSNSHPRLEPPARFCATTSQPSSSI